MNEPFYIPIPLLIKKTNFIQNKSYSPSEGKPARGAPVESTQFACLDLLFNY